MMHRAAKIENHARRVGGSCRNDQRRQPKKSPPQLERGRIHLANDRARSREVTNYPYWLLRCEIEREPRTLEAQRLIYQADNAFRVEQDLLAARQLIRMDLPSGTTLLQASPRCATIDLFGEDMMDVHQPLSHAAQAIGRALPREVPAAGHPRRPSRDLAGPRMRPAVDWLLRCSRARRFTRRQPADHVPGHQVRGVLLHEVAGAWNRDQRQITVDPIPRAVQARRATAPCPSARGTSAPGI